MKLHGRRSRRLFCGALVALASAITPSVTAAPIAGAAAAYSVQTIHVVVNVGASGASETCNIVADLYRPAAATVADPAPAVMATNGFLGSKKDLSAFSGDLASDGYVVLAYTGLGWSGSTCPISIDDPGYDGMAASELVDFLAGTRAATNGLKIDYVKRDRRGPIVGMVGGSYAGGVQFAAVDAEMQRFGYSRIRTIIPQITWNDLSYSLAPNNAGLSDGSVSNPVPGVEKEVWSAELLGTGTIAADNVGTCGDLEPELCGPFAASIAEGYPDASLTALIEHASVHNYMSKIHVPVMLMQGEDDSLFELHESVANYEQLRAQGTPVKLVWQSWGHTDGTPQPGEFGYVDGNTALSNADGYLTFEGRLITEWFNHYLRGAPPAPSLDFSFYRPWVKYPGENAALAYGRASAYPVGHAETLELSGSDQLVDQDAAVQTGSASFITPAAGAPTSTGETTNETNGLPPVDVPGTFAEYETAPLVSNLDVIGIPSVRLSLSDPLLSTMSAEGAGGDLTLFLKLYDISPNGTVTLPDGLVAAARIASVAQPVTVTLPGIVHQFAQGDRLALVIAGSDSEYRGDLVPQPVTVLTSASSPGQLQLPMAPASSYGPVIYAGAPVAVVHAPARVAAPARRFAVRWGGTDAGGGGLVAFEVEDRVGHRGWRILPGLALTGRRAARVAVRPGRSYRFRVRAKDAGGNWSPWSHTAATVIAEAR